MSKPVMYTSALLEPLVEPIKLVVKLLFEKRLYKELAVSIGLWVGLGLLLLLIIYFRWRAPPLQSKVPYVRERDCCIGDFRKIIANRNRRHEYMRERNERWPNGWQGSMIGARKRMISVPTPEAVEYVLKTQFESFEKGFQFREFLSDLLGDGIFNSDGDIWRRQRKAASAVFKMKSLKTEMLKVFHRHGKEMCDQLHLIATERRPVKGTDMQVMFQAFTLDAICSIAFGAEIHAIQNDGAVPFAVAFDRVQHLIQLRAFNPIWRFQRFFNISKEREISKGIKVLDDFAYGIIRNRRQELASLGPDQTARSDLLSLFMGLKSEVNGKLLYDKDSDLRDIVLNFLIAGRDTTASLLSWAWYELALQPKYERELLEEFELLQVRPDVPPTYDQLNSMKFTAAFLNETLRMHPPVPVDFKTVCKDAVLPGGLDGKGIPVEPGVVFVYSPWSLGRNKKIWGEDVDVFRPERWLERDHLPTEYEFPVFNAGFRICLGKTMALLEAKAAIAMVLPSFKFRLLDGQLPIEYANSLTLPMKAGIRFHVEKRAPRDAYGRTPSALSPLTNDTSYESFAATGSNGHTLNGKAPHAPLNGHKAADHSPANDFAPHSSQSSYQSQSDGSPPSSPEAVPAQAPTRSPPPVVVASPVKHASTAPAPPVAAATTTPAGFRTAHEPALPAVTVAAPAKTPALVTPAPHSATLPSPATASLPMPVSFTPNPRFATPAVASSAKPPLPTSSARRLWWQEAANRAAADGSDDATRALAFPPRTPLRNNTTGTPLQTPIVGRLSAAASPAVGGTGTPVLRSGRSSPRLWWEDEERKQ